MQGEHHTEIFDGISFQTSRNGSQVRFGKRFCLQNVRPDAAGLGIELDGFYDFNQIEFPASGNKNSHEPFLVEQYQRQFMDTSETEYNTAPAAYGVYNTSDLYHPLDHIDPAMLDQAPYQMSPYAASMNSFDESVTTGNHAGGISLQQVDGSCFQNDSSQSSTNNIEYYIRTPVSKKSRKAAEPIALINNSKLDRRTLKRMRNRVSASRCRSKKKEWITDMEETNSLLHEENIMLQERVDELHELIAATKRRLSEQANGKRE